MIHSIFNKHIAPENHRFFRITQSAYIIGVIGHVFGAAGFAYYGVIEMVWFNCLYSIPAFLFSFFINRKGFHNLAFVFAFIELLVHQALGIYFLGWGVGFQYWLIYLIGLSFFNEYWKKRVRIFCFLTVIISYIVLYLCFQTPETYILNELQYTVFYISSASSSLLLLALLINYYVRTASSAEDNLKIANKTLTEQKIKIEQTLKERDHALECLDRELSRAADYVKTILPEPLDHEKIKIDWKFIPSASLGGDTLGYHWLDKSRLAIYLIDVSGHGVSPALLSVSVVNTLRSQSLTDTDFENPGSVLTGLNKTFPSHKNNAMFFTIWYGIYNIDTQELSFASGGHPPGLLIKNSGNGQPEIDQLSTPNLIVGALEDAVFTSKTVSIPKNAKLLIYSDGAYEIKLPDDSIWKLEDFIEVVSSLEKDRSLTFTSLTARTKAIGRCEDFSDDYTIMEISFPG